MKKQTFLSISVCVLLFTTLAKSTIAYAAIFRGGTTGGGGIGVLCDQSQPKLKILDFYESENVNKLLPLPPQGDLTDELREASKRKDAINYDPASPGYSFDYQKQAESELGFYFKYVLKFLPEGQHLSLSQDATKPMLPPECRFVQIALAVDQDNKVYVDSGYWNMLDARNQAGLILHETMYHARRHISTEPTSDSTRKFVGQLFSMNQPTPRYYDYSSGPRFYCQSTEQTFKVSFTAYQSEIENSFILNFDFLGNVDGGVLSYRTIAKTGSNIFYRPNSIFRINTAIISDFDQGRYEITLSRPSPSSSIVFSLKDKLLGTVQTSPLECY